MTDLSGLTQTWKKLTKLISLDKTTNVKNMHPHSNPGPWITVPML